jgi:hypothetical protein
MLMMLVILLTFPDYRYFAIIPLVVMIYLFFKQRGNTEHLLLFLVWTLVILSATMSQRRFAYYLTINISLLSAFISWQIIWLAGLWKLATRLEKRPEKEYHYTPTPEKPDYYEILGIARGASYKQVKAAFRTLAVKYQADRSPSPEAKNKFKEVNNAFNVLSNPDRRREYDSSMRTASDRDKKQKRRKAKYERGEGRIIGIYRLYTVMAVIAVFFFVYFFNIMHTKDTAATVPFAITDAWQASLLWMKDNTPDPREKSSSTRHRPTA